MLSNLYLKIVRTMKAHIQGNLMVPHSTLVALAISASITVIVFGILYMADIGTMGIVDAEAAKKFKPRID
jgi:hypothetical protein